MILIINVNDKISKEIKLEITIRGNRLFSRIDCHCSIMVPDYNNNNLSGYNMTESLTKFNPETVSLSGIDFQCEKKNGTTITDWSNDPLFYIITVLLFYALSIIILMVKYIRRERQEAEFDSYYYEFVTREKFQTAQFRNTQTMCNVLKTVPYIKVEEEVQEPIDDILEDEKKEENSKLSHTNVV